MKRGLQIFLGVLSLIPAINSMRGILFGTSRFLSPEVMATMPAFDSLYRYNTGYYLSLALIAWWIIPNIEKHAVPLRIVIFAVFVGGVGRAISWLTVGMPPTYVTGLMILELCLPLVLIWQAKLPERRAEQLSSARV